MCLFCSFIQNLQTTQRGGAALGAEHPNCISACVPAAMKQPGKKVAGSDAAVSGCGLQKTRSGRAGLAVAAGVREVARKGS